MYAGRHMATRSKTSRLEMHITPVLKRHGIFRAGLFGSAARGELRSGSDIDIVVQLSKNQSMVQFIALKQDLERRLARSVDLVEYRAIKPALRARIMKDHVAVL